MNHDNEHASAADQPADNRHDHRSRGPSRTRTWWTRRWAAWGYAAGACLAAAAAGWAGPAFAGECRESVIRQQFNQSQSGQLEWEIKATGKYRVGVMINETNAADDPIVKFAANVAVIAGTSQPRLDTKPCTGRAGMGCYSAVTTYTMGTRVKLLGFMNGVKPHAGRNYHALGIGTAWLQSCDFRL